MRVGLSIITLALLALELVGIYLAWRLIGAWTLAWLAGAVILGIRLLRQEQIDFMPRLAQALVDGRPPLATLLASFRRILAAVLLIFPGIGSDLLALVLLFWPGGRPPSQQPPRQAVHTATIIEGEYRRVD